MTMNGDSVPTLREIGVRVHRLGGSAQRVGPWFIAHAEDAPPRQNPGVTREGVIYDPRTEQVRARFTLCGNLSSAVLGDDARVYSMEESALVSRRDDGADLRTHEQQVYDQGILAVREGNALFLDYNEEGPAGLSLVSLSDRTAVASLGLPWPWFVWFSAGRGAFVSFDVTRKALLGFEPSTLRVRWTREIPEGVGPAVGARTLSDARRVLLYDDVLWCVDADSGDARVLPWRRRDAHFWALTERGVVCSPRSHTHILVLRALDTGAPLAEFAGPEPLTCVTTAGGRVFALDEGGVMHVLSLDDNALLAAERLSPPDEFASWRFDADEADVFIREYRAPLSPQVYPPVTPSRAMRGGSGVADLDLDARDLIVPESLLETEPVMPATPPGDPERLEVILAVLREEEGSRANAWERLVARGVIPSHFDPAEFPIVDDSLRVGFTVRALDAATMDVGAWVALAHDAESLVRSRWLAHELAERLRPWCTGAKLPTSRWRTSGANRSAGRSRLLRRIFEAIEQVVRVIIPRGDRIDPNLAAARTAWEYVRTEGLRVPPSGPAAWVGERFDAMPDPFGPWEALTETGHPVLDADDEWITLAFVPLTDDFAERIQDPYDDDIPF